jgi:hypothetical protein
MGPSPGICHASRLLVGAVFLAVTSITTGGVCCIPEVIGVTVTAGLGATYADHPPHPPHHPHHPLGDCTVTVLVVYHTLPAVSIYL